MKTGKITMQYNPSNNENVFWFEYKQNILHSFMNAWGILSVPGKVFGRMGAALPMQPLLLKLFLPQDLVDA